MKNDITLLLAEDDKGHYILTRHCLRSAGIENELLWFSDGGKIQDFLYVRSPESTINRNDRYILMLDIRMPKIDGITLLERMKRDDKLKNIPVIIVTTSDAPANIAKCSRLGCCGYVIKPLGKNLIGALEKAATCFQPRLS